MLTCCRLVINVSFPHPPSTHTLRHQHRHQQWEIESNRINSVSSIAPSAGWIKKRLHGGSGGGGGGGGGGGADVNCSSSSSSSSPSTSFVKRTNPTCHLFFKSRTFSIKFSLLRWHQRRDCSVNKSINPINLEIKSEPRSKRGDI